MNTRALLFAAVALSSEAASGCNRSPFFAADNLVTSVRVLAVRASQPYTQPGATVDFDALAYDGRANRPRPMSVSWIPTPCVNPDRDDVSACYPAFAEQFQTGVDLTEKLHAGTSFSVAVPPDALQGSGAVPQYHGTMYVFQMACAGRVQYLGRDAEPSPASVPFGCFDEVGRQLGTDDFEFAFAVVFVVPEGENANPTIDGMTFDGKPVSLDAGITVDACSSGDAKKKCAQVPLDTIVPASSQEPDPSNPDGNGTVLGERVWVDYYATEGALPVAEGPLYDPSQGKSKFTSVPYQPPQTPGEGMLFAVVHDSRAGVAWLEVPLHVK